ncbi:MAG TPA: metallophosphoesterase family protein [Aggregatilineales bacterium]|nr:metallophosphoesterase family protein [Aggregatilineales bacterium]
MRLAVISDIHGNLAALDAVLADLKAAGGADKLWVLGDLCAFGPRPAECLARLRDLKDAHIISGNTDRYIVTAERPARRPKDEAEWAKMSDFLRIRDQYYFWATTKLTWADHETLSKLGRELDLDVPGYGGAIGYHGAPGSDERNMFPDTPDEEVLDQMYDREGRLAFGGHTHYPMDRDLGLWRVINVGSVGLPFDEASACYVIVTFVGGTAQVEFRRVPFDIDAVIDDLKASGNPSWQWTADLLKHDQGQGS